MGDGEAGGKGADDVDFNEFGGVVAGGERGLLVNNKRYL